MLLLIQILSYFCYFERERGGGNLIQQATPEQKPPTFHKIRAFYLNQSHVTDEKEGTHSASLISKLTSKF